MNISELRDALNIIIECDEDVAVEVTYSDVLITEEIVTDDKGNPVLVDNDEPLKKREGKYVERSETFYDINSDSALEELVPYSFYGLFYQCVEDEAFFNNPANARKNTQALIDIEVLEKKQFTAEISFTGNVSISFLAHSSIDAEEIAMRITDELLIDIDASVANNDSIVIEYEDITDVNLESVDEH